ncbi:MAG: hypothetical protein IJ324_03255 [Lachnospiraceae bacterium]|nr:hypothetical protein [Lachnospiraceae bacterium]
MSYVQDFAREMLHRYGLTGILIGLLLTGVIMLALHILMYLDGELKAKVTGRNAVRLMILCSTLSIYILYRQQGVWHRCLIGFVMLIYLAVCSITDYYSGQVYDLIQLGTCVVIAVGSLLQKVSTTYGVDLIIFAVLQMIIFRKMYGDGDVMCFLICALSVVEKGIFVWVCHMGISFLLLGIVQGRKHNIAPSGNLRTPVPFIPYIAVAYGLVF